MKGKKIIILLTLCLLPALFAEARERAKPRPMKELTDPKSHSYVPFPYPRNRREITADLEHYVKKNCFIDESKCRGGLPPTEIVFRKLVEPGSGYKVGEFVKVKNRSANQSDDYSWLVIINGPDGFAAMRVSMTASGLLGGAWSLDEASYGDFNPEYLKSLEKFRGKLATEKGVRGKMHAFLQGKGRPPRIKKMERIGFYSSIADIFSPAWEIVLDDGSTYYYNPDRKTLYELEKKVPWDMNTERGVMDARKTWSTARAARKEIFRDSINDQFLILNEVGKLE